MADAPRRTPSRAGLVVLALVLLPTVAIALVVALSARVDDDPNDAGRAPATLAPPSSVRSAPSTNAPPSTTTTAPTPDAGAVPTTAPPDPPTTAEWNPEEAPVLTYAQPPLPADCPTATGTDRSATFTWTGDGPSPGCLVVRADQQLSVVNRSGGEISVSFVAATVVLGPNDEQVLGRAGVLADGTGVRYLWVTGHPEAVGIVNIVA